MFVVVHRIEPAHLPIVDPGVKRRGFDAGLTDAAARERLADAMRIGPGHRRMAHPDLLVGPAFLRRPGCDGLTKQRPLRAIGGAAAVGEISGHVPPLDAKRRMRAVIGGKCKRPAGNDRRKSVGGFPEPGKALRESLAAESGEECAADETAAGDRAASAHWQRS